MTIHRAVLNAIAALPAGQVKADLELAARSLNWKKNPLGPNADAGATVIRFDEHDPAPKGSAAFRERPAIEA